MIEIALTLLCFGVTMMAINGASTYLIYTAGALILGTTTFIFTKHLYPALEQARINRLLEQSNKYANYIKESDKKNEIQ